MIASVIVWDRKDDPSDTMGEVLCWRSYEQGRNVASVPRYIEDHAERLRDKYLAFIHDLGESRIDGRRVVDHLNIGDGFSFWWMGQLAEKSPFKSPQIYDCLRLLALEEILLDRKPSRLTLHSSDQNLVQTIGRLCQNLKIGFYWRPAKRPKQKWSLRRIYQCLPYPLQGLIKLVRHFVTRWPLRNLKKPQWFSGENAVFLCSYFIHLDPISCAEGRFYSRQWGTLTKYLHDNARPTNWIQHFLFSPVVPDVQTGLSWLRLFNRDAKKQGYHAFLDTYLTWSTLARVLKTWFWLNAVSWRLRSIQSAFYPQGSAVWLWPILRSDWLTSLSGPVAINNCLWVELFDAALKDIPPQKTGLYLCENQGWERALLRAWRRHGHGSIIGVPHATVPFWHLYYFNDPRGLTLKQNCAMPLPDRLAVNGTVAQRAFSGTGYPTEQLVEVEALRYLGLSQATLKLAPGHVRSNVLILGDMIPTAMHNLLRLLEKTIKLLPSGYKFTLKPHPGCAVHLADYPNLQASETSESLDRILGEYDIVLAANSTSASVDAYVAGLPVIIALDSNNLNLSPLRGHPGVSFVSTPDELAKTLPKVSQRIAIETNRNYDELFFLDPELLRWKQLLSSNTSPQRGTS